MCYCLYLNDMYIVLKVQEDILKIIAHFVFSWFDNNWTFMKTTQVVVFKQLHNL